MQQRLLGAVLLACLLLGSFAACTNTPNAEVTKPLNPNGDSELALLMRTITKSAEAMQAALNNGTAFPEKPQGFEKMITATRTKKSIQQEPFAAFAQSWLGALDQLYAAPPANRKELFNALITNCQSCHATYCRGPLDRIASLHVK